MGELLSDRLELFRQLMASVPNLYFWEFDPSLELLDTNCEEPQLLMGYFRLSPCKEYLVQCMEQSKEQAILFSDTNGFSYVAVIQIVESQPCRVYMLGPIFLSENAARQLTYSMFSQYSQELVHLFREKISVLPTIPITTWRYFGGMLYYAVNGKKMSRQLLYFQSVPEASPKEDPRWEHSNNTWFAEQQAMKMIEDGNLDYEFSLEQMGNHDSYSSNIDDPSKLLKKMRSAAVSYITLCTRAAIRGGIDPEMAYYLGEIYCDKAENSKTLSDLMQLVQDMYHDFVLRVHQLRSEKYSPCVQKCCNYIQRNLHQRIPMSVLAEETGYEKYYLSRKFKSEMGISVNQYQKLQRIEKAKDLLRSTPMGIQDIAGSLGYSNTSHFIDAFRDIVGKTPGEFRMDIRKDT